MHWRAIYGHDSGQPGRRKRLLPPGRLLQRATPIAVAMIIMLSLRSAIAQPAPAPGASTPPAAVTAAAKDETASPTDPVRELAARATASTVGLYCKKDGYASFFGTGTVIAEDGHILTSTTVIPPGAEEIMVVFANFSRRQGSIVESNEQLETTLLKVDG